MATSNNARKIRGAKQAKLIVVSALAVVVHVTVLIEYLLVFFHYAICQKIHYNMSTIRPMMMVEVEKKKIGVYMCVGAAGRGSIRSMALPIWYDVSAAVIHRSCPILFCCSFPSHCSSYPYVVPHTLLCPTISMPKPASSASSVSPKNVLEYPQIISLWKVSIHRDRTIELYK